MIARWIFTVSPGRSGQATLSALLDRHVEGAYVAFEEPQVDPILPGFFGDLERNFRRRFVETDELLGRGKVLAAYAVGDDAYIDRIVARRLAAIRRKAARLGARIYIDINSHFAKGLHRGFVKVVPKFSLIRLVRDPLQVMRSYLNRRKSFHKDHNTPDAPSNVLRLDPNGLTTGELYLWAWCEMYLRFDRLVEEHRPERAVEIRTEELNDPDRMNDHLDTLALPHSPVEARAPMNTNVGQGWPATSVTADDIALFELFLSRLPAEARRRIRYFDDYDPYRRHAT